jgi:hypothetical protein
VSGTRAADVRVQLGDKPHLDDREFEVHMVVETREEFRRDCAKTVIERFSSSHSVERIRPAHARLGFSDSRASTARCVDPENRWRAAQ